MFQYAFYKSLQTRYPSLDIKMYDACSNHNGFELDRVFGIEKNECSKTQAEFLDEYFYSDSIVGKVKNKLSKYRRMFFGYKQSFLIQNDASAYYDEVYSLSTLKPYILHGYWQNSKYFKENEVELLKDFTFIHPLKGENINYSNLISSTNSVGVHVRRGDYLKVGFPVLSTEYYKEAIKIINKSIQNPRYYIFTNDKEYVHENFGFLPEYTIVEGNSGDNSYIDMQLMSICKHNIIANSTFSFWAAYLNKNTKKIVISPNKIRPSHKDSFPPADWMLFDIENYSEKL